MHFWKIRRTIWLQKRKNSKQLQNRIKEIEKNNKIPINMTHFYGF